jgi:hypothetical protein
LLARIARITPVPGPHAGRARAALSRAPLAILAPLALLAAAACADGAATATAPRAAATPRTSLRGSAQSAAVFAIADFTISPDIIVAGRIATGTETLSAPAPAGGLAVAIWSSNSAVASAPSGVVVAAGDTRVTFDIRTSQVSNGTGVQFTADVGSGPRTATLDVTPAPSVSVWPLALTFASQAVGTTSPAQLVTVRNPGTVPLTLGALGISGPYTQSSACPVGPATLAPGASCTIAVAFAPASAGNAYGQLTIPTDALVGPVKVALGGSGFVPTPALSLTPGTLGFGSVPLGAATSGRIVKITSTGNAPLVVSSVTLGGANPGDFAVWADHCTGASLLPGASCTLSVSFEPLRVGTRAATLTVAHNAAGGPAVVSLGGTGVRSGGYIP